MVGYRAFALYTRVMTTALTIDQLSIERDDRLLLSDFSLTAKAGSLIQVAGANGAGKSTLLRTVAGLYQGYQGNIRIGQSQTQAERRAQVMLWTALPAVKARLTARQNLQWLLNMRGDLGDADLLLSAVGLRGWEDALAGTLSTGQARRIVLASLFPNQSPVWCLDEPFNAIDVDGQALLANRIRTRISEGGCVLLATHHTPADLTPDQIVTLGGLCE